MLTLRGEKSALWRAWKRKDQSFYQSALECRAVGLHWNNIKQIIRERRVQGEELSVEKWARQHAPVTRRWLDEFGDFANRWSEFVTSWRWSKSVPYAPERRAGLHTFLDLMLAKRRFDTVSKARQENFGTLGSVAARIRNSVPVSGTATFGTIEPLTPASRLICGDVADMLRAHIADGIADLVIADPPYWLSRYLRQSTTDRNYLLAGMVPRFNEEWDKFEGVEHYESVADLWLTEVMRCLGSNGSAFIFGSYYNIGLINRICQLRQIYIISQIAWVVRNSRPNATALKLQASYHSILWIAKEMGRYRFNYRDCKRRDYAGDYFADRGKQLRDTWDIAAAPHENKRYNHPSPKPLAVYQRILDVAGKPGGLMLDLFSGSGSGAVAAMRWGMESISVERDAGYCDMIRRRVADELQRRSD